MLVYEGTDNPGQNESAQAEACYNRCKSYRLHAFYDGPTPPSLGTVKTDLEGR